MIDVLGPEKRRRHTTQEKIAIVQQSFEPEMTVSLVARQHGVAASQLFLWRKQYQEGSFTAVAAGEQVVPASELAAAMRYGCASPYTPCYQRATHVWLSSGMDAASQTGRT